MLRRALFPVIAFLGVGYLSVAPVIAQEEDLSDMSFEQKLIHQLMTGLGAKSGRERGIDYRERSPLVLPPTMELPPPEANAALAPNWPKDPDEQARKEAAAAAKMPRPSPEEAARPLMPSELAKGRIASNRRGEANPQPGETRDPGRTLLPNELGYRGGLFGDFLTPQKEETAAFTGEPTRNTLTAPPAGYQTPSPAYPYGLGAKAAAPRAPSNPVADAPVGRY